MSVLPAEIKVWSGVVLVINGGILNPRFLIISHTSLQIKLAQYVALPVRFYINYHSKNSHVLPIMYSIFTAQTGHLL